MQRVAGEELVKAAQQKAPDKQGLSDESTGFNKHKNNEGESDEIVNVII